MSCSTPQILEDAYNRNCDILVSYAYKKVCQHFFKLVDENGRKPLFMMDSGAFTNTAGNSSTYDAMADYINFVNSNDKYIDYFVQLDRLPGFRSKMGLDVKLCQETAAYNKENYLYMRGKVKSPEKLMPVYHSGEPLEWLDWLLDFEPKIDLIALSLRPDTRDDVMTYLNDKGVLETRKFHLLGVATPKDLHRMNCWSSDASSFIRYAVFNIIPTSLTTQKPIGTKRNPEVYKSPVQRETLEKYFKSLPSSVTFEKVLESWEERIRLWLDYYISKEYKDFVYIGNVKTKKKLF